MKDADFRVVIATVPLPKRNGTHRTSPGKGREPKRSTARPEPQPIDAAFAASEPELIDAPMWPLHAAHWFQPELAPSVPVWSGLAIIRHNRIPGPGFLHPDIAPSNIAATPGSNPSRDRTGALAGEGALCGRVPQLPDSGLAPLGWDARAMRRKEGE
jgi:hypothetical protein